MQQTQVINLLKKKIVIVILLLSFNFTSFSQNHIQESKNLKLNFSSIFYQPLKFKSFGYNNLRNVVTPTFQIGIGYTRVLKKNWGFDIGVQYSLMGFRTRWYELSQPYVNEEFIHPKIIENTTYLDHRITFETGIHRFFYISNDFYIHCSYMLALNSLLLDSDYIIENILFDQNSNVIGESYFSMVRPNVKSFDMSLSHSFKIGVFKENKKHLYSINFVYNIAPKVLGIGTYKLDTPDFKGGGVLYKKSSYFGLEYNWYFKLN